MNPKISLPDLAHTLGVTLQAVHQQIKLKKHKHYKMANKTYFCHDTVKPLTNFKFESKIMSFQIVKGGTGKTLLCLGVGVRASLYGARTLLIDLDQQGNLTKACGIIPTEIPIMIDILNKDSDITESIVYVSPGLDIIPSRIENALLDNLLMLKRLPLDRVYKDLLTPMRNKYDLILIDCPPALGNSVTAISLASDSVIAPVTPSEFSLAGLEITRTELAIINKNFKSSIALHPVVNEYDTRTSLSNETLRNLISNPYYKDCLLRSVVRRSQEFENTLAKNISIYDGLAPTVAKEDIDTLTRELLHI
jgi:chromosome partitioning protein